ncbi:MAG: pilus assembly protein TadG-related protein, partial [Candidatus Omnitrophota bacterium]
MLRWFKKTTSLSNLKNTEPLGQVATVLILIMAVMLVAILITANLGQVSYHATSLANAADSACLYLASYLASRAHQYWKALGYQLEMS